MTEGTIVWKNEFARLGEYIAQVIVTATGQTITVNFPVRAAVFLPNRASAATDSWGVTFTAGEQVVTITLAGTTSLTGTLLVYGDT